MSKSWIALAVSLAICLGAAALGAALTDLTVRDWYATLEKPSWNPPNWIFGPVWTTLYVAMAVAAWLVWRRKDVASVSMPLAIFGLQLVLNVAWSGLFFAMRSPGLALIDVMLLWIAILATIATFARVSRPAAILLVPYLAWVSFATLLNATIWHLNR